jgi:iron complex transport system substrate-binding protein
LRFCRNELFAVWHQDICEIKYPLILQPGATALTDGLAALQRIVGDWANRTSTPQRSL